MLDGLELILQADQDFSVVGSLTNGEGILDKIHQTHPDVLLLDLNLPGKNGLEIIEELILLSLGLKIIVLTMYNSESITEKVEKSGAHGFLLKDCSFDELKAAIVSVCTSDDFYFGVGTKRRIQSSDNFLNEINLTTREREIVLELIQGLNVPQVAKKLFISPLTVETHKKNIFRKLEINTSLELLKFASDRGLL